MHFIFFVLIVRVWLDFQVVSQYLFCNKIIQIHWHRCFLFHMFPKVIDNVDFFRFLALDITLLNLLVLYSLWKYALFEFFLLLGCIKMADFILFCWCFFIRFLFLFSLKGLYLISFLWKQAFQAVCGSGWNRILVQVNWCSVALFLWRMVKDILVFKWFSWLLILKGNIIL